MIRVLSLSITRVEILIIGIHKIYSFCGPFLAFISDFRCLGLVASWLLTFRGCEAIVPYIGDMMNPDISLVMGNNRLGLARPAGRNWGWIGGHPFVPSSTWHPGIGARIDHGWMGKVYIYYNHIKNWKYMAISKYIVDFKVKTWRRVSGILTLCYGESSSQYHR